MMWFALPPPPPFRAVVTSQASEGDKNPVYKWMPEAPLVLVSQFFARLLFKPPTFPSEASSLTTPLHIFPQSVLDGDYFIDQCPKTWTDTILTSGTYLSYGMSQYGRKVKG